MDVIASNSLSLSANITHSLLPNDDGAGDDDEDDKKYYFLVC